MNIFIETYIKGIENEIYLSGRSNKRLLRVFIFCAVGILFSRYNFIGQVEKISWVNGKRGYERMLDSYNAKRIYHGTFFYNPIRFMKFDSCFSCFTFHERIKIFFNGLCIFCKNKKNVNYLWFWIEYCFIVESLNRIQTKKIYTTGMCDRYTTWISYWCKENQVQIFIFPHGVLAIKNIPNKIFCNKIYPFSQAEKEALQQVLIENDSCDYEIQPFKSIVKFNKFGEINALKIGIIAQVNPKFVHNVLDEIQLIKGEKIVFIMLHPLDKWKDYLFCKKYKNVIILKKKKILDCDLLLLQNSTLLEDYMSNGFDGKVIRIDPTYAPYNVKKPKYFIELSEYSEIRNILAQWENNY